MDGVLCDFYGPYYAQYGNPKNDFEITKNINSKLKYNKQFWLNLPKINTLNWTPRQYTTARIIPKQWIKEYLKKEGFPKAPIYQIPGYSLSKYQKIRMGGCHLHIDDSLSVFLDLTKKGMPCLLYTTPENQHFKTSCRIYSLNYQEIEQVYNQNFNKNGYSK